MGEAVVLVCDVCGGPAVETVSIKGGRTNRVKDLCRAHLDELLAGSRPPRRGRKRQVAARAAGPATRRGRPTATGGTTGKRRGRPRKAAGTGGGNGQKPA